MFQTNLIMGNCKKIDYRDARKKSSFGGFRPFEKGFFDVAYTEKKGLGLFGGNTKNRPVAPPSE